MDNFNHRFLIQGFLLLFASYCHCQEISIEGGAVRQVVGRENAIFECKVNDPDYNEDPNLKWFDYNGVEINPDQIYDHMRVLTQTDPKQLRLLLENITMGMGGVYRCKGLINGKPREASVLLKVAIPIITTHIKTYQAFTQGEDAIVNCSMSSADFTISWYDTNGQAVGPNSELEQVSQGLKIDNITTADGGVYTCEIMTTLTFEKVPITVFVKVPPVITQSPSRQETITGQSMRMECRASGIPEPKYEWFKSGQTNALVDGDRFSIDEVVGTFIIREVIIDDQGIYRCEAWNDAGRVKNEAELDVLIPPSIRELNNASANEGTSVKLSCLVNGNPLNSITWQKGGIAFNAGNQDVEGNSGDLVSVKTNIQETDYPDQNERLSELTINNLVPEDTGIYECHADGGKSGSAEGESFLTVRYQPVFAKDQPDLNYTWAGQTGVLRCTTHGEPLPKVRWYRGDMEIQVGQSYFDMTAHQVDAVTREALLMIRVDFGNENEVYTTYTCEAYNDMGTSNKNITLVKSSVPVLNEVATLEVTPTTARFSAEVAAVTNGPPPTHILVEYGTGNATEVQLDRNGPTIVEIQNLQVSTPYTFQFYAKSEAGKSLAKPVSVTTLATRKPYPSEIMSKTFSEESTRFLLKWTLPKTGGAPILNFNIRYRQVSILDQQTVDNKYQRDEAISGWFTVTPAPKGGTSTKLIEDLVPSAYYEAEVTATNVKGTSDPRPFIWRMANVPPSGHVSNTATVLLVSTTNLVVATATSVLSACLGALL